MTKLSNKVVGGYHSTAQHPTIALNNATEALGTTVVLTDTPKKPCWICGSNDWWLREGEYLCNVCHPCPLEKND